jgi:hypothetical protein
MKVRGRGDSRPDGGADTGRLMRQDDNGNRYRVADFPTHDEAEQARKQYEARGHRQIYWVEAPGGAGCS